MGLVSGEKHISLSQVLIPRVTNNTNLYGTVTDLKTNTPDKKSRPIWGVMRIVRRAFLPKLRRPTCHRNPTEVSRSCVIYGSAVWALKIPNTAHKRDIGQAVMSVLWMVVNKTVAITRCILTIGCGITNYLTD